MEWLAQYALELNSLSHFRHVRSTEVFDAFGPVQVRRWRLQLHASPNCLSQCSHVRSTGGFGPVHRVKWRVQYALELNGLSHFGHVRSAGVGDTLGPVQLR